ncbi:DivIVA domain-containing protein [Rhodococcus kronopolitis]|uniref:DivIVA domain-containing protein n=1 Tax=Rhodococcus kronopolitis TaxID=1460226 RepID=A0ABV9FVK7_9NOCA
MFTVLLYLLVMALVGGVLFLVASTVFGRGEEMAPLPPGTTVTALPARNLVGADVQALRFQQTARGYKMSEVDWALERLAAEIDALRDELAAVREESEPPGEAPSTEPAAAEPLPQEPSPAEAPSAEPSTPETRP